MSMSRDSKATNGSAGKRLNGYTVGYCRPPQHTQFQPGRSGNPAGREKGVRNLKTDVQRTLKMPVTVNEAGRARKISTQEGALLLLREKALIKGESRALERLLELAGRYNSEPAEPRTEPLPAEDQEILAAYLAKASAAPATCEQKKPSRRQVKWDRASQSSEDQD
jgi:hypothetical protein